MCLLPSSGYLGLGATKRGVTEFSKLPTFDVKVMSAIVATLIALASLLNLKPGKTFTRQEVARGEPGVLVMSHALSPGSNQIATTDDAGDVSLRDAATGWQIKRLSDFPGHATSMAFSPDGSILAVVGTAPGIRLWDLSPGGAIRSISQRTIGPCAWVSRLTAKLSPSRPQLTEKFFLWDLATSRRRMVLHHPSSVRSIAFSRDGRWFAAGGTVIDQSSYGTFTPAPYEKR
jgi:WD40 repeat protein